jgi:hypothetical protein
VGTFLDDRRSSAYSGLPDTGGLPDQNAGRFLSIGKLVEGTGVTRTTASAIGTRTGGLPELVIPRAEQQIRLKTVLGLNPEF